MVVQWRLGSNSSCFIAELRDPNRFPCPKQIERMAGTTSMSATRVPTRDDGASRIWATAVCAGHTNRNKNLVASIPQLLALMREGRSYEKHPEQTRPAYRKGCSAALAALAPRGHG